MDNNMLDISKALQGYIDKNPEDLSLLSPLLYQIVEYENVFSRSNFNGHITASMILISKNDKEILFIYNKGLDLWLFPGGHSEDRENPIETARRELLEETGIIINEAFLTIPFDIDVHIIPLRSSKNEPSHLHYDFRFIAEIEKKPKVYIQENEIEDFSWYKVEQLDDLDTPESLEMVIKKIKRHYE